MRILPRELLKRNIYIEFYNKYKKDFTDRSSINDGYKKMLEYITENGDKKWEDEDVEHWNNIYAGRRIGTEEKRESNRPYISGNRLYQRKCTFMGTLLKKGIKNKIILEIGCGTADFIFTLLLPDKNDYHYVATDYSIEALRYLRNKYPNCRNVTFIQCLGNCLPLMDNSVDYLLSLGVLNRMPGKEKEIYQLFKKIKKGGLLLLNEAICRPRTFLNNSPVIHKWIEPARSAHEERIDKHKMLKVIKEVGDVILLRSSYSPVRTLLVKLLGKYMERSVLITRCILLMDSIFINSIGVLSKSFGPGECFVIAEKKR